MTLLRAAAQQPVHAYLFVGPPGSGKRVALRSFAADLLTASAPAEPLLVLEASLLVLLARLLSVSPEAGGGGGGMSPWACCRALLSSSWLMPPLPSLSS